jgi:hypothetical protein
MFSKLRINEIAIWISKTRIDESVRLAFPEK